MLMRRAANGWCSLFPVEGSKWKDRDSNPGSLAQCLALNHNGITFIVSDPEVTLPNINKPWSNSLECQGEKNGTKMLLHYFCKSENGKLNAIHEDKEQGNCEIDTV